MNPYVSYLIGVLVGCILTRIILRRGMAYGTLYIDSSDPKKDVYRLSIDGDLDSVKRRKKISLKVKPDSDLSQQ